MRELLSKLDGGEGVQIDGIQDKDLQKLLAALLLNLELRFRYVFSIPTPRLLKRLSFHTPATLLYCVVSMSCLTVPKALVSY